MATGAMEVMVPRPRGQQLVEAAGITAGSTTGTSVTGGSPGGTKGSWAQVIASTAYHTHGLNGYSVASSRDAVSANSELRIDAGAARVQWSDDDGATLADDYALVTLGATQVGLMRLEPGDNTMRYQDGGAPSLSIEWSFHAAYE